MTSATRSLGQRPYPALIKGRVENLKPPGKQRMIERVCIVQPLVRSDNIVA